MAKLLIPNDGVRGVDMKTESGTKQYNADRRGIVTVDDPKHAKQMLHEGFTYAAEAGGFGGEDHRCTGCGFNSVFMIYTCPKCGVGNDFTKESNG